MPRTRTPPRFTRKWVKLVGSDFRLRYSQKLIRHVPGCPCHPAPNHWHYEEDKSQQPKRVPVTPTLLDDNGDGTYTQWSFGLFGPVGCKGRLKAGDAVQPLQSRQDFTEALRLERLFDWSLVRQAGMATVMGGARNPTLIQLAQAATDNMASWLHLSEDDARFLVHVLPRLPGDKDDFSPVTLDLGQEVLLLARSERSPQVSQVLLSGSSCEGPAVRVACNRRFLWRVVQLGFRDLVVRDANTPLLCRDDTRTYLFMPLGGALSPTPDAVRIVSGESIPVATRAKPQPQLEKTNPQPEPERSREVMPRSQNNGEDPRNGPAGVPPSSMSSSDAEPPDSLMEAEALHPLLHDAQLRLSRLLAALKQQRRRNRALRAAMDSLRGLRLDR